MKTLKSEPIFYYPLIIALFPQEDFPNVNEHFINQIEFKSKNAKLKIRKPDWIKE